jgi:hypothetical protein
MANQKNTTDNKSNIQTWLAGGIVLASLIIIGGLGYAMILIDNKEAANIFNIIIPVVSTWVGTVLAYYFSKENFAAATQSVTDLAKFTTQEKLKSIPVIEKMIPYSMMHFEIISASKPPDQIMLVDIIDRQEKAKKGLRIPILNENNFPLYVIHRSTMDMYITKRTLSGGILKNMTLKGLLEDPDLKKNLDESFGVVERNSTLADAKNALEKSSRIQDVFVTEKGTAKEAILGFITNTIVEQYSTV